MPQGGLRLERSRPQVGGEPSAHRQRQTSARDSRSDKSVGRPLQLSRVVGVATYRSCTWPGASMGTNLYPRLPSNELAWISTDRESADIERRFGYSPAGFRMLCSDFRRGELPDFFALTRPGPREQPKKSLAREQVVALRKRNYSIYDISKALKQQGTPLSATAVREILAEEGFAPLPRRLDEERPASVGPTTEAVADVRSFMLGLREFTTRVGGLFLFVPDLIRLDSDALAATAKLPGSGMV